MERDRDVQLSELADAMNALTLCVKLVPAEQLPAA